MPSSGRLEGYSDEEEAGAWAGMHESNLGLGTFEGMMGMKRACLLLCLRTGFAEVVQKINQMHYLSLLTSILHRREKLGEDLFVAHQTHH